MGQKVNPHALRLGVIKDWDSRWDFASEHKKMKKASKVSSIFYSIKYTYKTYGYDSTQISQYVLSAAERLSKRTWTRQKVLL